MDEYKLAAYLDSIDRKLDQVIHALEVIHQDEPTEDQIIEHHDIVKDLLQELVDYANDHY